MSKEIDRWTTNIAFRSESGAKHPPSYPNEMLVRICSSMEYSELTNSLFEKKVKVCEIGCFSGNNLRFLIEKGFDVFGVEINDDMINLGIDNLKRLGYDIPKIKKGNNLNIPFDDSEFDLFVSINVLHYCYGKDLKKSLEEYKRVTKKNGLVIIETAAPKHDAYKAAKRNNELDWTWNYGDFRDGQHFGFFDSKKHFEDILLNEFSEVEIATRHDLTEKSELEWFIGICKV
jgi:SAM-dependent methyltransferase